MKETTANKEIMRYFWRHMSKYPVLKWGMFGTAPLALLCNQFLPALIVSDILQRLSAGDYTRGDVWGSFGPEILAAASLSALGAIVLWRINSYFNWTLESKVVEDISQEVYGHLLSQDANFHADHFGGSLVSQTNKLASAYTRITDTTVFETGGLFWSLVFTCVLLRNRAPIFVLLLLVFSALFMYVAVRATNKVRYYNAKEAEASNRQTGELADGMTNVMAVKSFAAEQNEHKRFSKATNNWIRSMRSLMISIMRAQTAFTSVNALVNLAAITSAVASIVMFDANIATVFLVFTYTHEIRDQLWNFGNTSLRNYNRGFGDAQGMWEILNHRPAIQDPASPEPSRINEGAIHFKDVNFTHAGSADDSLFKHLNLDIGAGEKVGLVGKSGSGKTTLTRLLLHFSDIDGGEILIDGQNIARITQDDLRSQIAYVPQEPLLFHRSISENIAYGNPNATEADIQQAAKFAHAHDFIQKLPKGYDTLVGERGVKLSGGQRQRVAIARAMIKQAPILVLDEATSALDSESELLIQDALWKLMEGRTAIVIAHRLSTIQKMDRIIVLDNGTIAEQGSHTDLLKHKGTYAKLWAHQSGGFLEEEG